MTAEAKKALALVETITKNGKFETHLVCVCVSVSVCHVYIIGGQETLEIYPKSLEFGDHLK